MKKAYYVILIVALIVSIHAWSEDFYGLHPIDFKDGKYGEAPNGLKYYILNSNTELAHLVIYISAGRNCEWESRIGISDLTLEAITRSHLQTCNSKNLIEIQKDKPCSLSIKADEYITTIKITFLKEDLEFFLKIFREILFNATLTEKNVEEAKDHLRNIQSNRKESVLKNTRKELFKLLYGENTAEGQEVSRVSYTKISTKDVISFYKKYYIPSNCFIGISSSLPLENIEQVISKTFFALSNGGTQKCPIADKADNESIVVILQKTGLEKSVLGVGKKINLPQGDQLLEDLPKLELVTAIINSDSPSARLVKQFMVDRNLAEILDFSFYVSKNPKKGYYLVFLYPDSKRVGFSAYIVGRVFSDLITNPPTLEELNQGKMALLGNFNFIASDPERLLETNMDFILRGFPPNYLKTYSKILIGCTADDLVKICKEYLSMTKYQYVIYGSGENFSREMSVFGKVTIRNASIEN